ncbi:MAG: hypothetical protein ACRD5D_03125 [Candidatus Polarisedimenticolia bacterium]
MDARPEDAPSAPADELTRRMPSAPPAYLEAALGNPALTPAHLALGLRNPQVRAAWIQRVARDPRWLKAYEVKAAMVLHPATPRTLAMNLVGFLWWRDLVRVSEQPLLAPPLRRAAERLLGTRLPEMALGEKVTLARLAGRGIIAALRREGTPLVVRALLQNPRLIEEDVLAITASQRSAGEVLRAIAEEPRWSTRPPVQKAIARHPETPKAVALRMVQSLGTAALKELLRTPKVPRLVKAAAERIIEARQTRAPAPSGGDAE